MSLAIPLPPPTVFVDNWRPWPLWKCAVVGCRQRRWYAETEPYLIRRWCREHALEWDLAVFKANAAGLNNLIEVDFGKVSK